MEYYSVDAKLDTGLECMTIGSFMAMVRNSYESAEPCLIVASGNLHKYTICGAEIERRWPFDSSLQLYFPNEYQKSMKNVVLVDQQLTALAAKIAGVNPLPSIACIW